MSGARRVLIAHIPYEHRGGEDVHVEMLAEAYRRIGMEPVFYPEDRAPRAHSVREAAASLLPGRVPADFLAFWTRTRPAYIHLHNAFPTLGPGFFEWVLRERVPLVMTVHNHRFYCTNGLALRGGRVCKDCLGSGIAWRPLAYNCNGDLKKSAYHAAAMSEMRLSSLYERAVRKFIAPSPYIEGELVRFGIQRERIFQIVNPVEFDEVVEAPSLKYDVLYAGRLSPEKGMRELVSIFHKYLPDLKLAIAGDGPERAWVEVQATGGVSYLGSVSRDGVSRLILQSRIGVLSSICNEILPTFVLECFVRGRRCVLAEQGSVRWLAGAEFPGVLAPLENGEAFAGKVREALGEASPSAADCAELREKFAMNLFCENLKRVSEEVV